jgi:hypothetical protein
MCVGRAMGKKSVLDHLGTKCVVVYMAFAMLFIVHNRVCAKQVRLEVTIALAKYFVTVIQY